MIEASQKQDSLFLFLCDVGEDQLITCQIPWVTGEGGSTTLGRLFSSGERKTLPLGVDLWQFRLNLHWNKGVMTHRLKEERWNQDRTVSPPVQLLDQVQLVKSKGRSFDIAINPNWLDSCGLFFFFSAKWQGLICEHKSWHYVPAERTGRSVIVNNTCWCSQDWPWPKQLPLFETCLC